MLRLGVAICTLWAVATLVFIGTGLLPGDPVRAVLGREATQTEVTALRREFGLDRPLLARYESWMNGLLHGNLGLSFPNKAPVANTISGEVQTSALLALAVMAIVVPLGIFLGVASAIRPGGVFDSVVGVATSTFISTPEFVTGSLLVYLLAIVLRWLPAVSLVDPSSSVLSQMEAMILPVITVVLGVIPQTIRLVRASTRDVLESSYVELARLKGVSERRLLLRHVLPNALAPAIQAIALTFAGLVSGVIIVENLFNVDGIGLALENAVARHDLPYVQAITILIAAAYIVVNFAADAITIVMNPRLRRGR